VSLYSLKDSFTKKYLGLQKSLTKAAQFVWCAKQKRRSNTFTQLQHAT